MKPSLTTLPWLRSYTLTLRSEQPSRARKEKNWLTQDIVVTVLQFFILTVLVRVQK